MDVSFITTTSDRVNGVPIVDGQVIAVADAPGYYYDMLGIRYPVTNLLKIDDGTVSRTSVFSSAEVDSLIKSINEFKVVTVTDLPQTGSEHIMYFLRKTDVHGDDYFDEYMWISNKWELVGHTKVNYGTVTEHEDGLMWAADKRKLDGIAEGSDIGTITSIAINGDIKGVYGPVDLTTLAVRPDDTVAQGSTIQPVYVDEDGLIQPITCTIETSVPVNAKFTDTTLDITGSGNAITGGSITNNNMTLTKGQTFEPSATAVKHSQSTKVGDTNKGVYVGTDGQVHATSYEVNKSVPSDAKFTDTTYENATQSTSGLLSSTDKTTLDKLTNSWAKYDIQIVTALPSDASSHPDTFYVILE